MLSHIQLYNVQYLTNGLIGSGRFTPEEVAEIRQNLVGLARNEGLLNSNKCSNIDRSFAWSTTIQGWQYWNVVHRKTVGFYTHMDYSPPKMGVDSPAKDYGDYEETREII